MADQVSNKDESIFISWHKDPNIGNRQRTNRLLFDGEDPEIKI
jgi:hypothetical protein